MKLYDDIESERDRIEACIHKFGWTSDHNLDWFSVCTTNSEGRSAFSELDDGGGILFHIYKDNWQIWSDPLCDKSLAVEKIIEFVRFGFDKGVDKIWCNYVSDSIYPLLEKKGELSLNKIEYSLDWPILNMEQFDLALPGGHFKDIRNAQNKFNREPGEIIV